MKDNFIKNLPYALTTTVLLILSNFTRLLNKSAGPLCSILVTLLFIIPIHMNKFISKTAKTGWSIAYIITAIIELFIVFL